jgi:protein gp37
MLMFYAQHFLGLPDNNQKKEISMQKTKIEWTDSTWNPMRGCRRVSQGCVNCYAEKTASRFNHESGPFQGMTENGKWTGNGLFVESKLHEPLTRKAPQKIFVNSMSDLFFEVFEFEQIAAVYGIMCAAPRHTFQVLTKRPFRALQFYCWLDDLCAQSDLSMVELCWAFARGISGFKAPKLHPSLVDSFGQNIWLGTSVEDQKATHRIEALLHCPAHTRFVSCEPLIGPVDLLGVATSNGTPYSALNPYTNGLPALDWVIVGGESQKGARPMEVEWMEQIVTDCEQHGVACFTKQMGSVYAKTIGQQGNGSGCIPIHLRRHEFPFK